METSLGFDFVAGLWGSKQKPRRGKDEDLRFSAQRMWVLRDDGVDAVCVCVMPLSEFPIVFSYPHYAQRTLIESCKTKCRVCILFLSLVRTTRFKLKPKTPSRHLCSDIHVSRERLTSRGGSWSRAGTPPPLQDHHRVVGIALLWGPRWGRFLMSEVPLYRL